MKKSVKKIFALLLIVSVLTVIGQTVFAENGNVTYSGDAGEFLFAPGSKYSPTDLFEHFYDVMPGDTVTQQIVVRNNASKEVNVTIYMRSLGAHEDSVEFLNQMTLTVTAEGDTELFHAPADETAQLTEWTCLGTFDSGAEVLLNVTLEVPIEMDNYYQEKVGFLDWEFMVEEEEVPHTGDETHLGVLIGIFVLSALALVALLVLLKKKKKDDQ